MSLFGDAKRLAYGARGEESVFSLDGDLNLPKGDLHGLRERLAFEVARGSFDEAVLPIETTTGASCPKRPAEELAAKVSPTLRNALIPVIPIDSPDRVYRCER